MKSVDGSTYTERLGDEIIRYIEWHWRELQYPPSLRKIGKAVGIPTPSTVREVLNNLEKQGRLTRHGGRTIKVTLTPSNCTHEWRIQTPVEGENLAVCGVCGRRTGIVYAPTDSPETWLIYRQDT